MRVFPSFLTASLALSSLASAKPVSVEKRSPGKVAKAGNPVVIDSGGVYIRASQMNDGSIIVGYAAQAGADHVLRVARSTDGAASWQYLGEVARGPSATHDIDNAMPLQLPSGRVVYAFRNHDRTTAGVYTYYRITICYSDDGGKTWKYLSQIDERVATGVKNGFWEPFLRLARDGTLQVFYSGENNDGDQDNFMKYSKDGGATWSGRMPVSGGDRTSRDGMTGVAPIDNNRNLICVFENTETGPFSVDYVISRDDGYTWGERGRLYTASGSGKTAGAPQVYNVWGTLVVSFMTNENVSVGQLDGGQMKVVTSTDGAKTWSASVVTGEQGSHWPGLFNRDPTHFLALYSKDGLGAVSQLYELQ